MSEPSNVVEKPEMTDDELRAIMIDPKTGVIREYYFGGDGPHYGVRNSSLALAEFRPHGLAGVGAAKNWITAVNGRTLPIKVTGPKMLLTVDTDIPNHEHLGTGVVDLEHQCRSVGADVVVLEGPGLFLGEDDDLAGPLCESLEHSLVPQTVVGEYRLSGCRLFVKSRFARCAGTDDRRKPLSRCCRLGRRGIKTSGCVACRNGAV